VTKEGPRLFSVVPGDRTRGNKETLKSRRLHLKIRKHLSAVSMTRHYNRLPREVIEPPSVETVKI